MSIDLSTDLLDDDFYANREDLTSSLLRWYGRDLSLNAVRDLQIQAESRIIEYLFQENEDMAFKLAWLGSSSEKRSLLEKEIAYLLNTQNGWEIQQIGFKKAGKFFKHLWKDHKEEIIIGAVIVAAAIAITAVAIYASGAGTQAAVAGGAALVDSLANKPSTDQTSNNQEPTINHQEPNLLAPPQNDQIRSPITPIINPDLSLEEVYGPQYISNLYRQFQLPDPYLSNQTPDSHSPPIPSTQPSSKQQFIDLIEQKLRETKDPLYLNYLSQEYPRPPYNQQFVEHIEDALREASDPQYKAAMASIEELFQDQDRSLNPIGNNYASSSLIKPTPPFQEVPLLGFQDQSTVHFHCGINNNFSSLVEGGLTLRDSLDENFAVQPHLVHSNSLVTGLTFVGLEKLDANAQGLAASGIYGMLPIADKLPGLTLQHSQIQRSIDYEVENLSKIAQNIIDQNNPNLKQMHITFSNGGYIFKEALAQLPPEYQDTIIVITAGTTAIIEDGLAHKVYNLIGDKDWPSIICNGGTAGIEEAKLNAPIKIIPQGETSGILGGHYAVQPDYQSNISELLKKEIISEFEIY